MSEYKDKQNFDCSLIYIEHIEILRCYDHFSNRYLERFGVNLAYKNYWEAWIQYLRGVHLYTHHDRMFRVTGNYAKGTKMYKIIYTKINDLNIFVPLTIYEVIDHKKRYDIYIKILDNKKLNKK
jgi:tRNA(His) 5'-end guanylyltransferase